MPAIRVWILFHSTAFRLLLFLFGFELLLEICSISRFLCYLCWDVMYCGFGSVSFPCLHITVFILVSILVLKFEALWLVVINCRFKLCVSQCAFVLVYLLHVVCLGERGRPWKVMNEGYCWLVQFREAYLQFWVQLHFRFSGL